MSQFYDLDQEKNALAYALATAETCADAMSSLRADLFEDYRHQRVAEATRYYYQTYGGVLDRNALQTLLTQNETPTDKQIAYLTLFDEIRSRMVPVDAFKLAIEVLENMRFKRGLFDLVNRAAGYLQKSSVDRQEVCNDIVGSVLNLQAGKDVQVREMSVTEQIGVAIAEYKDRKENPEKYRGIPFGMNKIDTLTGGVLGGELAIIFGRPASGKSSFLHNVAYYNAMLGKNSLYVSIEMPKEQIARRLYSRHLQISARGLRNANLMPHEEEKFFAMESVGMPNVPGKIFIADMPQGCSAAQIVPLLRRKRMAHRIDMLLIDYMTLMEPVKWSNSMVERTGAVGRELKQLARVENIPVITPARASREVAKLESDDDIGTEHVSWSDAIGYDADLLMYLKKGKMINALEAQTDVMLVKFRDGANEKVTIGIDYDKSFMGDLELVLSTFRDQNKSTEAGVAVGAGINIL